MGAMMMPENILLVSYSLLSQSSGIGAPINYLLSLGSNNTEILKIAGFLMFISLLINLSREITSRVIVDMLIPSAFLFLALKAMPFFYNYMFQYWGVIGLYALLLLYLICAVIELKFYIKIIKDKELI